MNIVIAGGSGFLGSALAAALAATATRSSSSRAGRARRSARHARARRLDARRLRRRLGGGDRRRRRRRQPGRRVDRRPALDRRAEAADPRQPRPATRSLVAAIGAAHAPPAVFVSGSAVGYYGPRGDERHRGHAAGRDFLATVCCAVGGGGACARRGAARAWSASARAWCSSATAARCRRCCRRSGSAPAGRSDRAVSTGRGFTAQDWIDLVRFAIRTPQAAGPLNATAPNAGDQRRVRHGARPRAAPAGVHAGARDLRLRLLLGEMADALLLSGQRAIPARAERLGHSFAFKELDSALRDIFGR